VRLWDSGPDATLPVLRGHTNYVYPVACTPDSRRIASGSWDGTVRLWDAATGQSIADPLPHGGFVRALALSPDGTRLVAMGDGTDGRRVWDVASRRQVATYRTAEKQTWAVAYRPGGAHIAVLGPGHVIEILDAATGKRLAAADAGERLEGYASRRSLAYSPDGLLLAGPYEGNRVGLWEAESYRLVGTLAGHEGTVLSVAFSADGRRLASAAATPTRSSPPSSTPTAPASPRGAATACCACGTRPPARSWSGCPGTPVTSIHWPSAPTARRWFPARVTPQ
jgi:WD40 repeat protein